MVVEQAQLDALVAALRRMTDGERLAFAHWAVTQPDPTTGTPWVYRYGSTALESRFPKLLGFWRPPRPVARSLVFGAHEAVIALHEFRGDGTMDERDADWEFRDGNPFRPREGWQAAVKTVWMLAVAILTDDPKLRAALEPALVRLLLTTRGSLSGR